MAGFISLVLALAMVGTVGALMAYSLRKGRGVIAGIFGLPGSAEHQPRGVQEEDPPPRWNWRSPRS